MRRRDAMGLIGASLGLSSCWGGNSWNQKLTVTVRTPMGEVSGSAVTRIDMTLAEDGWLVAGYAYKSNQQGEAAVVEVAPGKYVFALLAQKQQTLALKVFVDSNAAASPKKEQVNYVQAMRRSAPLASADYPLLVTFADIDDPKSVTEVKPGEVADVFGAGYSLKSITLEITDEKVTDGKIKNLLGWLDTIRGRIKPIREPIPANYKPLPIEELNSNSFIRGI